MNYSVKRVTFLSDRNPSHWLTILVSPIGHFRACQPDSKQKWLPGENFYHEDQLVSLRPTILIVRKRWTSRKVRVPAPLFLRTLCKILYPATIEQLRTQNRIDSPILKRLFNLIRLVGCMAFIAFGDTQRSWSTSATWQKSD